MPNRPDESREQTRRHFHIAGLSALSLLIGVYEWTHPLPGVGLRPVDDIDLIISVVFIGDFVVHARGSGHWRRYVRRHWWELPALIPITGGMIPGFPGFAPVRGLRLFRLFQIETVEGRRKLLADAHKIVDYVRRVGRRAHLLEFAWATGTIVLAGALAALLTESGPNPHMNTFWDALWWSLNLFDTVAYVSYGPVTTGGRVTAAVLEIAGVTTVGLLTAALANAVLKEPTPQKVPLSEVKRESRERSKLE